MEAPPELAARVEALLGSAPREWIPVEGGHTHAGRLRVVLADGRRAFCKWAVDDATAGWLRDEMRVLGVLARPFVPEVLAFAGGDGGDAEGEGDLPLLILEDLGQATWPPPWTEERAHLGVATLARVATTPPPPGLPPATALAAELRGWTRVEADPEPFLGLGLADRAWLERSLPALRAAEDAALFEGEELLHIDARGDNMAFLDDGRVVLVDWNWACVGNPALDLAYFANHVAATGGPAAVELGAVDPTWAAVLSGFFAAVAGLPELPHAPTVRRVQREHLLPALPWACALLDLEPPTSKP